jgi:catalase
VPRFVGVRLGAVQPAGGEPIQAEATFESMPGPLWDAVVVPDGAAAVAALAADAHVIDFLKNQYRHCKTILAFGAAAGLLDAAGLPAGLPDGSPDPGLLVSTARLEKAPRADAPGAAVHRPLFGGDLEETLVAFMAAVGRHRHFERETDPPRV